MVALLSCNLPTGGDSSFEELLPQDDLVGGPGSGFLEGFDQGLPPKWEQIGDWQFSGGRAVAGGPEAALFALGEWEDFHLFSRMLLGEQAAVSIALRATDAGSYHVFLEPGEVELIWDQPGAVEPLYSGEVQVQPGWHDVELICEGTMVAFLMDGELLFEFVDSQERPPGAVGFILHSGQQFEIDLLELVDLTSQVVEGAPEPEGQPQAQALPPGEPDAIVLEPPVASLISLSIPDEDFMTTITGQPGAVSPGGIVVITNLENTYTYFTNAAEDGSFATQVFAPPGSSVQIKHALSFMPEEEKAIILDQAEGEIILEWLNATTGTILRVPYGAEASTDQIPFSVSGSTADASSKSATWLWQGFMEPIDTHPSDFHLRISGTLTVTSSGLAEQIDLNGFTAVVRTELSRHFDPRGNQLPVRDFFVSNLFSPTGFPIYHGEIPWSPILALHEVTGWEVRGANSVATEISLDLVNEDHIPIDAGFYSPRVEVNLPELPEGQPSPRPTMRSGLAFGNGGIFLPLIQVGQPQPPRLQWGLLTDTLDEATRGTIANQDQDHFGLIPMISLQKQHFVIPKDDPKTGQAIPYRLEPFLPMIAYGDRGVPNPPTIDFRFPSGELTVSVQRPDGGVDILGPASFIQSVNKSPAYTFGKVRDYSNGGGALHEVYQLTTMDEAFDYEFSTYGHYTIEMRGTIEDVSGNEYTGGGVYDLYVARPLKLFAGMLPTTPFVVGDHFAPTVQVYPRVPAEITVDHQLLVGSYAESTIRTQLSGQANSYGYFHPGQEADTITFDQAGEYRVDIVAEYTDEEGVLWMGNTTWGNVVENVDTPIIAHGMRGLDNEIHNDLWFFHNTLGIDAIAHTRYPYYSGDVFWGIDGDDIATNAGNAISPTISLQDTSGVIYDSIRERLEGYAHAAIYYPGGIEESIERGEIVIFSTTPSGWDPSWAPESIDRFGYFYHSSQRPGARVHEHLGEGTNPVSYWRYGGTYGDQVGVEGDLPNDLKWEFGGVVFRDLTKNIHHYGVYASLWVLLHDDDPIGARITPPFQGATGGPNGGPIMTLKGEDIDLFFLPRAGRPGQVLEEGDTFAFSGHVGPPLNSQLAVTVTSPSGQARTISGDANKIGYFYQPEDDFVVNETGVWQVDVQVIHDGLTSSGPTQAPYPTGGVLGAAEGEYSFYVVPKDASVPQLQSPGLGFLTITRVPLEPIAFEVTLPVGMENASVSYTIAMPGFLLEEGSTTVNGDNFTIIYDPVSLHQDFPNLDLTAYDDLRPGLADQIWITAFIDAGDSFTSWSVTLYGEEVMGR